MINNILKSKIEYFNENIINNIDKLKPYYEHDFIVFCQLSTLIYENLNCLLLGLNQASIFTTNHLLERMLKVALTDFHTKGHYIGDTNLNIKLGEAKKMYDRSILNSTIRFAHEQNIISDDEKTKLIELKNEFRNPYSHADIGTIIKDVPTTFKGFMFNINNVKEVILKKEQIPRTEKTVSSFISDQYHQYDIAQLKAFDYFKNIFEIMISIDKRYTQ